MSLNDLIGETITNHPESDPYKITRAVFEQVDPDDLPGYFLQTLEPYVVSRVGMSRNQTLNSRESRSPKLAERRAWWAKLKTEQVFVSGRRWKAVRDCTVEDLKFVIAQREQRIYAIQGQILKFEVIMKAMEEHRAVTVNDLPDDAVNFS